MLDNYIWPYDNEDEYASVEEERFLLDDEDGSYYVPIRVKDINLSM